MGSHKVNHKEKAGKEQESPLVGTWISVGVVGVVIFAAYILLYGIYMARL
ncbi:MAG: hypothetical protein K6T88_05030 [Bacillus sp. (in: Bacteria)]|jgi:hypothetical protein|nr:hypothetical protein [Bacillus sp. (in: firmicutes)]